MKDLNQKACGPDEISKWILNIESHIHNLVSHHRPDVRKCSPSQWLPSCSSPAHHLQVAWQCCQTCVRTTTRRSPFSTDHCRRWDGHLKFVVSCLQTCRGGRQLFWTLQNYQRVARYTMKAGEYDNAASGPQDHLETICQRMAITMEGYVSWYRQSAESHIVNVWLGLK